MQDREFRRGCPSALTKYTRNLHCLIKPLRQAFYHAIRVTFDVKEIFVDWDPELQRAIWTEEFVKADNNDFRSFLNDPIKAVNHFLPLVHRPESATDLEWSNHLFGLAAVVCDLIAMHKKRPLHLLIKEVKEDFLSRGLIKNFTKAELKEAKTQAKLMAKKRRMEEQYIDEEEEEEGDMDRESDED